MADASPIRHSTVLSLFPTLVWKADLEDAVRERIHEASLTKVGELTDALRELAPSRSWQSDQTLHQRQELAELVSVIRRTTTAILEFLRIGYESFEITGCWANVNAPGAGHAVHQHPNNFLSGVYYVRVGEGADTIQFHDPRAQALIIRPPARELTGENTDMVVVRVQQGTLLLFPSWLEHSVPPNRSHEIRVSIGFNLMFSSYAETMGQPLWAPGHR